jgi:hypothetical protein
MERPQTPAPYGVLDLAKELVELVLTREYENKTYSIDQACLALDIARSMKSNMLIRLNEIKEQNTRSE